MSSKTKIVVLHTKELIYTGIFLFLGILLLTLLISMFTSNEPKTSVPKQTTKQEALIQAPLTFFNNY